MPRELSLILIFTVCVLGPALVIAACGFASINALGRNPSAAPKVFTAMVILLIFAEAIAVIALLVIFQLFSVK
ncbi:ATP synthase F0 subunit C [Candidatus Omnitrophota bacterium]